ncbi:MAG: hypothetical protein ACPGJS_21185 [Flammeovirgaceae bacterium]
MILLGFLIVLLILSLGKLFMSIDRFKSVTFVEKRATKPDEQFDELLFFDSQHLLANEGN